ncbi:N-acetylaspartate synthetase-like [Lingula anatina]|uniref:N-acetylaspartate synthetase-like n=1 Tax=Lingula anatina TaxID=7574 RepID=A0A1S3H5E1_LINAN|nr:N-acetylaspartate synthetase-like [Lingula anatina]|eukprot:XP_013381355.2 N-acetylaspartate synthetase-like [Lingula anatina]
MPPSIDRSKVIIRPISPNKAEQMWVWEMVIRNLTNYVIPGLVKRTLAQLPAAAIAAPVLAFLWYVTGNAIFSVLATVIFWVVISVANCYMGMWGWEACFQEEKANLYEYYNRPKSRFWVAEHEGRILGSVAIDRKTDHVAELKRMVLEPDFRGSGIASDLVKTAVEFCKENGYKELFLSTTEFQHSARALYTKCGFKETDIIKDPGDFYLTTLYVHIFRMTLTEEKIKPFAHVFSWHKPN